MGASGDRPPGRTPRRAPLAARLDGREPNSASRAPGLAGADRLGELFLKDPKSDAGRRGVPIPDELLDEMKHHLAEYAEPGESGRVFVGAKGGHLRRQNFRKIWQQALAKSGVQPVHFHDLRHTGNQFAADEGATLRELMERMGHSSPRAAMIYLHVSKGRSRHIADKLSTQLRAARATDNESAED